MEDLYFAIGEGTLSREEIIKHITPKKSKLGSTLSLLKFKKGRNQASKDKLEEADQAVPIKGLISGMALHYAGCCHPLPGDKITGVIHTGSGVTIHIADCEMLANFSSQPNKLIDLTWDSDKSNIPFICRLKIIMLNEPGSLATITTEIAKNEANITNFKLLNRNIDFFEVIFDLEVYNTEHVDRIIHSLQAKKAIHHVERYKL